MEGAHDWQAETERAERAAEEGRWDCVRAYYDRRAAWPAPDRLDESLVAALAASDRQIELRLLAARAAAAAVLEDASSARRTVGQWRAKLQIGLDSPATVSRRA